LTQARHVSGLFAFSADALLWSWQRRDFTSRIQIVVNSRRENLLQLDAKQCPIPHRSVRKNCIE